MIDIKPHLMPKVRSDKIMRLPASGIPCTLRISGYLPGGRCSSWDTCVMTHLPVDGKGMSTKVTDIATTVGCARCHDLLDGRDADGLAYLIEKYPSVVSERMLKALIMTHTILIEEGVIVIPDAEMIASGPWRP